MLTIRHKQMWKPRKGTLIETWEPWPKNLLLVESEIQGLEF